MQHLTMDVNTMEENEYIVSSLGETDQDIVVLIGRFVNNLPDMVTRIRQAAEEKSWGSLANLTHELIGVSGNYGFECIVDLGRAMEQQIQNQEYSNIIKHIEQLQKLQSRVVVSLDGDVNNSKTA